MILAIKIIQFIMQKSQCIVPLVSCSNLLVKLSWLLEKVKRLVEVCCYLGVNICSGKYFVLIVRRGDGNFVLQQMVLYLINSRCLKNLKYTHFENTMYSNINYGAGMWKLKKKSCVNLRYDLPLL